MRRIDAQIHVWEADRPDRPWPPDRKDWVHGPATVTAESIVAEMDAAGVAGALLIPPSFEGDYNDLVIAAATRYPDRFRAIVRLWLAAPDARDKLLTLAKMWQVVGTRVTIPGAMRHWLTDGTLDWFWPFAAEQGIAVTVFPFGELPAFEPIARRYPTLKLSIDHLAVDTNLRDAAVPPVIEQLLAFARYPNVAVKATCLPAMVTEPYPFRSLRPLLRSVLDAFGPERTFFGSDLTRLPCTYRELIAFFDDALADLTPSDKALVMGEAAARWYGWTPPPPGARAP
jgi:L-fuconolactonase